MYGLVLIMLSCRSLIHEFFRFFFFNDTATTEIYTLSLHDALPICGPSPRSSAACPAAKAWAAPSSRPRSRSAPCCPVRPLSCRSEEHTSELQSRQYLVCRLLLEKKKNRKQLHATGSQASIKLQFCR